MPRLTLRFSASEPQIKTVIGIKAEDGIRIEGARAGVGLFGPYISLPKGHYTARIGVGERTALRGRFRMDVSADHGVSVIAAVDYAFADGPTAAPNSLSCEFDLQEDRSNCEVRLHCDAGVFATLSGVEFELAAASPLYLVGNGAEGPPPGLPSRQILDRLDRLERLSHGGRATYVGNNRVFSKVAAGDHQFGFYVQADDRLLGAHMIMEGEYERELTAFLIGNLKPTDHCLDIGGNVGYYTCLMGRLSWRGRTIGIEPDLEVFELLRDNINVNGLGASATAIHAAVADAPGRLMLHRRLTRSGNTSIINTSEDYARALGEAPPVAFEVECVTIDDLLPRFDGRIDVIKIDVEGAEPLVFRGMRETLAANPDVKIIFEWSPGQIDAAGFAPADFIAETSALGFEAAIVGADRLDPIAMTDLASHVYLSAVLLTRPR